MVGGPARIGRWTLQNWSGDPPKGPEVVGGPPEVRKWSRDPPGGMEVVKGPSRRSGSGLAKLPEVRKWSGDLPGGP